MKRLAFLFTFVLLLASGLANAEERLNEQAFSDLYVTRLVERFPELKITSREGFAIKVRSPDDNDLTINLDNAYLIHSGTGEPAAQVIGRYIESLVPLLLASPKPDPSQLLVTVRDPLFERDYNAAFEDANLIAFPLGLGLKMFLVLDSDTSSRFVSRQTLEEMNLSADEAKLKALENLKARSFDTVVSKVETVVIIESGPKDYASTMLAVDDFWKNDPFSKMNRIVVFPISRDVMLAVDIADDEALRVATGLANTWIKDIPYHMTAQPFVLNNGSWEPVAQ
jgi:hypothetical protein